MRVMNMQPVAGSGGGIRLIAQFDVQLTDDIRLHALRLMEAPDGNRFVYAAQCGSRRAATFARSLAEQITEAASKSYVEANTANVKTPRT